MTTTPDHGIPPEKLRALLEASDEMMRSVIRCDRKATFDTLTHCTCALLNAESCVIFSITSHTPPRLIMEASYSDLFQSALVGTKELLMQSNERGGLTGHIAATGKVVRISSLELKTNRFIAGQVKRHRHLRSHECFSLLAVPLIDIRGHILGLLKLENKKGADGQPGEHVTFDALDEQFARILANKAIVIIESLKTEEDYRRSASFFSSMVERLKQNVFCKDLEGHFTYVNERFAELRKMDRSEILGRTDYDLYPTPLADKYTEDDKSVIKMARMIDQEEMHASAEGEKCYVRVIKTPIRDAAGRIIGVQGIFWDITKRRQLQDALSHEQHVLRCLLNNIPDNVYFKDLESRFQRISKHLADQFGLNSPDDAINKTDADFFMPEHTAKARVVEKEIIRTRVAAPKLLELELYLDGRQRYVLTTKVPWFDATGHLIGTFGISRDIDELILSRNLFQRLLTTIKEHRGAQTAVALFKGLHRILGFKAATLYIHNSSTGYMERAATYGLGKVDIRSRRLFVGQKPCADKNCGSLVELVFHQRRAQFMPDVSERFCDQEGTEFLKLKAGTSAIAIPLEIGEEFLGVMIVFAGDAKRQIVPQDEAILKPYADICALAISAAQANSALFEQARVLKAYARITHRFGMISVNPQIALSESLGEIAQNSRRHLTWIIKVAMQLLRARLGALYLADEPVCVSSADPKDEDPEYARGTRKFILRAMHRYPIEYLDEMSYTPGEKAITASVLRTRRARSSEDVEAENDWSGKAANDLNKVFTPTGLRAWIGVPIVFRDASRQYLFGVITFTRGRKDREDGSCFSKADQVLTDALARLLALALQSLNVARMERVTRATVQAKRNFEWTIAHETSHPVKSAYGDVQNLLDPVTSRNYSKADIERRLRRIQAAILDAKTVMDTLLQAARATSNGTMRQPVDLVSIARQAAQVVAHEYTAKNISFEVRGSGRAISDAGEVQQILFNLVRNSARAVFVNGMITVVISNEGDWIILKVTDDGPGVAPEDVRRLVEFAPFFRGKQSPDVAAGGHGLGLYLSERLARANSGSLKFDETFHPGCRFVLTLPAVRSQADGEGRGMNSSVL